MYLNLNKYGVDFANWLLHNNYGIWDEEGFFLNTDADTRELFALYKSEVGQG